MDRKRIWEIIVSIFIAVIFIASYASFGNNNNTATTTSTSIVPQTVYGVGTTNVIVKGYGQLMYVNINCTDKTLLNSTSYEVSNVLGKLELNNSISNYFATNQSSFNVYNNKLTSLQIETYVDSTLSNSSRVCTNFKSELNVSLPLSVKFSVGGQKTSVYVPPSQQNATLTGKILNVGDSIPVRISALLTAKNGTYVIYGNFSMTPIGGT
ncbi:MAG: hypothetical protein ACHQX1_03275 [Candidatus Micrarchaeales archaeon]